MAGYRRLDEAQMQRYLGWTAKLYHEGKTAEDIAKEMRRPLREVKAFIEYVEFADKAKAKKD